jgi:serine phosphatase RsbU (regulator of sigma subunit)
MLLIGVLSLRRRLQLLFLASWATEEVQLAPGDLIALYSDGRKNLVGLA